MFQFLSVGRKGGYSIDGNQELLANGQFTNISLIITMDIIKIIAFFITICFLDDDDDDD